MRGLDTTGAFAPTFAMRNYSRITREPDCFDRQRLRREHQASASSVERRASSVESR
jgi:hypothetical protein